MNMAIALVDVMETFKGMSEIVCIFQITHYN